MGAMNSVFSLVMVLLGISVAILLLIFVLVPILKGVGWSIAALFRGIGFLIGHVFEFIFGMIGDSLRFVGTLFAMLVLSPLAVVNVLIGRWSAAGHFADSVRREIVVAGQCLYRVALKRPLHLLFLDTILEGVEQRVPEAMAAAPGADRPSKRVGQFPGYTIVGSLKGGGSGAKLYIAHPSDDVKGKYPDMPDAVVIKSFALDEGSSLPQIVRESRALECAKKLGLVFEHSMDAHRFFYVMPYHDGDHLGLVTRQLHGETDGQGLDQKRMMTALGYLSNLVGTLESYHQIGLWHKDVKPENVIVHGGEANLVDLGLVTPLRSAMTLTTHGTEYFRDPEMVRQALRGVKVHQVNGAKFDVYAAGAVLYFMIENDFPAHGALSRFTRSSPESVKWIVRRAMADYSHRYESAAMMLADIEYVLASRDPFNVKPVQLPSMGGSQEKSEPDHVFYDAEANADASVEANVEAEAGGKPKIPVMVMGPWTIGSKPARPAAAAAGAAVSANAGRPKLNVTSWWTGAYDAGNVAVAAAPDIEQQVAAEMRHEAQSGVRKSARQQVRSARRRTRELRQRVRDRRHSVRSRRQPGVMLGLIGVVFLAAVAALVFSVADSRHSRFSNFSESVMTLDTNGRGPNVLALATGFDFDADSSTKSSVLNIVRAQEADGVHVIMPGDLPVEALAELAIAFAEWQAVDNEASDERLEDALARYGLFGILDIQQDIDDEGTAYAGTLYQSARPDATDRVTRPIPVAPAIVDGTWLIVNDHPTRYQPEMATRIESMLKELADRGYGLKTDAGAEAEVRAALPSGLLAADATPSSTLQSILQRLEFAGILMVQAPAGDDPSEKNVEIVIMPSGN